MTPEQERDFGVTTYDFYQAVILLNNMHSDVFRKAIRFLSEEALEETTHTFDVFCHCLHDERIRRSVERHPSGV